MGQKFLLSKWYMDCTTTDGNTIIAYTARVNWRAIQVSYNAYLIVHKSGKVTTCSAMGKYHEPENTNDHLIWSWRDFKGRWSRLQPAVREMLVQNQHGGIDWNCLFPLTQAEIQIKDEMYKGTGYCEKMEMTIPAWKLPIDELYWGRYTDEKNTVTWIEWRGPHPLKRIFYNGNRFTDFTLTENGVSFDTIKITFHHPVEIRKGNLISTVFKSMGWIKKLFPVKSLYMREYKYAAAGVLHEVGKNEQNGRVIFERVVL